MTFKEKLAIEAPSSVSSDLFVGGCEGCPVYHGYETEMYCLVNSLVHPNEGTCSECWNREMEAADGS